MYIINPHIPAYYFNNRKRKKSADGKYIYYYPNSDRLEQVEVSGKVYTVLKKLDEDEYDPWWNYPDKKSFTGETKICERLDREEALADHSEEDKAIYRYIILWGYSQSETAEILGISQSTISRKLKEIRDVLERQFITNGTNTKTDIDYYVAWNELRENDDDVILKYIFRTLTTKDLQWFLYWFYSLKELLRYMLKYLITREDHIEEDIQKFLSKASSKDKKHFEEHYRDQSLLLQCVYVNMLSEVWQRARMSRGVPHGENYYKADVILAKIVKRLKTTEDDFLCKRFLPFLSKGRSKRHEEFMKKYKH